MKRLYIARHGAAQSAYEAGNDYARRLTRSGEETIRRVAEWLSTQEDWVVPERILTSAAPRAARTAELMAEVWGVQPLSLSSQQSLYSGRPSDYLHALVHSLPDEVSCTMVVGHNPTVSELLADLLGTASGEYLMRKGDVACLCFDVPTEAPWDELYAAVGHLKCYVIASAL